LWRFSIAKLRPNFKKNWLPISIYFKSAWIMCLLRFSIAKIRPNFKKICQISLYKKCRNHLRFEIFNSQNSAKF
jgi:hypothetical protein